MIPEAEKSVSQMFQSCCPHGIVGLLFRVLPPIGLNDQLCLNTDEINDIRLNDHLATKLVSVESTGPQVLP